MFDPNGLLVQGFILITGIAGQLYVAHMNLRGFYFWLAGNVVLIAVSVHFEAYGMALLYGFYSVMALYSIQQWKKRQHVECLTSSRSVTGNIAKEAV